jgi:hypothetical protein
MITDADRFLVFLSLMDPTLPKPKRDTESLIKFFTFMTGWPENRARSAFEICVVKGHIGNNPNG